MVKVTTTHSGTAGVTFGLWLGPKKHTIYLSEALALRRDLGKAIDDHLAEKRRREGRTA